MKRIAIKVTFLLAVAILLMSQAFAFTITFKGTPGYDIFWTDDVALADFFLAKQEEYGLTIANVSHDAHVYTHMVEISYDELASKVTLANNNSIVTSLYKNTAAGYWVGYVYDVDQSFWDVTSQTGVLSNGQGYVYVAEIDTTGEDTVDLLDLIRRATENTAIYVNSISYNTYATADAIQDIFYRLNTWDDAITKTEEHLASIQSAMINIPTRLQDMHTELMDISDVLTGGDFTTMMVDVGDISSNLSQVKILLAQIYDQLASSTKSGTLAYNIAEMVTLLEDMQDLTISGDLTIDTVEFDTSALEAKLDAVDTTLTNNLFYNGTSAANYLQITKDCTVQLYNAICQQGLPYWNAAANTAIQLNARSSGSLVSNVSTMLTNQENILTDLDSLNQVLESLGNIEGDFSALPNDIYSFITQPIENFEQRVMNSLELNDGYLEGISNNLLDLRDAVSDMTDAVSEMNETTVENITNITINEGDPAYEVFYVTDKDGNKQNLGDLGGDMLIAGGKLLNFFFKVAFDGAIESVDTTIDGMTEFYLDDAVVLEGSLWE